MNRLMIALAVGVLGFSGVSQGYGLIGHAGGAVAGSQLVGHAVHGPHGGGPRPTPSPNPCGGATPAC